MIANASDVKACLERVLALMAERDKINEDIADVLDEYKPKGVLGKGIRRVATLRRMDPNKRRSDEQLYTDYEDALGSLPEAVELVRAGKTYDEAAEATGLSRATVARMVKAAREVSNGRENETPALPAAGVPAAPVRDECLSGRDETSDEHSTSNDGENGEASQDASPATSDCAIGAATPPLPNPEREARSGTTSDREADTSGADAGQPSPPSDPAAHAVNPDPSPERVSLAIINGQGTHPGTNSDDLTIPPFLRRERVSA